MDWLDPWLPVAERGSEFAVTFEHVLAAEVTPGHSRYGIPVEAIGRRGDDDDVQFRLLDGSGRVAVVHLTWTQKPPERPPWPWTEVFPSLEARAAEGMRADHHEYTGG